MEQQIIANGGLQNVPQVAVQYVYLDFDGELTSYNGEILTVDNVEVKDSSLTAERIANILAELNAKYAAQNVIFVTEKPTTAEYSTIFVGKTSAFDQYGSFAGLAETIDEGNKIKNDNAFVMLDSTSSDEAIIATISHETDHLLGTLDHGGEGVDAYADNHSIAAGITSDGLIINSNDRLVVYGTAKNTTVNFGSMEIYDGGIAEKASVTGDYYGGYIDVYSGGKLIDAISKDGGEIIIYAGAVGKKLTASNADIDIDGYASGVTIMKNGEVEVGYDGTFGKIYNTTIEAGGSLYLHSTALAGGYLQIEEGATVTVESGAKIAFTVSDWETTDGYMINNLSLISGTPTFSITASADQAAGIYKLAQGASDFNETISIGDGTVDYGSITVNGDDLVYNDLTYSLDQVDGNLTLTITESAVKPELTGNADGIAWGDIPGENFVAEYSTNSFANSLQIETARNAVDTFALPAGTYQWRVKDEGEFVNGTNIVSDNSVTPQNFVSDADGDMDLFFANANGTWEAGYAAKHQGFRNGWTGTKEQVLLVGKNKITDVFSGSEDANILLLSDSPNGDALFVEDIYTSFGNDDARISQIDEIRAGAGDDIIDMTSQKFAYSGDEMTIRGGLGNDTIWANNGNNTLFGDGGNDRIVAGSDDDYIIGGIGDDSMHGGGGDDIFCFNSNCGNDIIEQLADGTVTLWFESDTGYWDAENLTYYYDANNSVAVEGVDNYSINIYFGKSEDLPPGVFADAASEKIFEDKNSGMLA